MATQAFIFFGIVFVVLLVLARRNGAFGRRGHGDLDGRGAYPQIQPGGTSGQSIRDPRARVPDGDKLGRR